MSNIQILSNAKVGPHYLPPSNSRHYFFLDLEEDTGLGGKGGGNWGRPWKRLEILRKSSVGIDARLLLKNHINSYCRTCFARLETARIWGAFSSLEENVSYFLRRSQTIISIPSCFVWFGVAQFHSQIVRKWECFLVLLPLLDIETLMHDPTSSVSPTKSQVRPKK